MVERSDGTGDGPALKELIEGRIAELGLRRSDLARAMGSNISKDADESTKCSMTTRP